jgi:DNA-binding transcriptional regulator of glucitol operon
MAGIARNIERYNLAYKLAWKHISELQKREYPNVATFLHDDIRRQLQEGAVEPVFIAAEALKNIEKMTGQIHSDEEPAIPADDRNSKFRRALRFATGLRS